MSNELDDITTTQSAHPDVVESAELAEIIDGTSPEEPMEEENQEVVIKPDYSAAIISIIRGTATPKTLKEKLLDYHENDIADALSELTSTERKKVYRVLDIDVLSTIFEYAESDTVSEYLCEMDLKKAAGILSCMETDAAVDILRAIEKEKRILLIELLDDESRSNIALIASFDEDEIGSKMTTNYIVINENLSIKQAMSALIEQAEKNDNISTIFVVDDSGLFCGAIDLKELIIARQGTPLDDIITTSFPYVYGNESISECIEKLKNYSEDSIPVLDNNNRILGVITSQSIVEVVDEEMGDDYAKLAGLVAEEDLNEPVKASIGKRLPWLLILLGLGIVISTVVGSFEKVVASLPIVMAFQSLILGMAGNAGTQSLAVTIRVLADESVDGKKKSKLVVKEICVAILNGLVVGAISTIAIGLYLQFIKGYDFLFSFSLSGCSGISMVLAMFIAGAVGTLLPMLFKKIKVDPAVASGPLITSVNDLVAVLAYYGLCWLFLIKIMGFGG